MRIVKVIHGYPMRYNAGSEVYSQTLCHGLAARGHEVHVFTREEDSFAEEFALRREPDRDDPRVQLHLVNVARSRDRYRHDGVDRRFAALLDQVQPHVVHIGHLNHLSTSLVGEANRRGIPVLYTLHDYWVMCPRGQLMQMSPADPRDLWAVCDGQDDRKCAERCYSRYFSGADGEQDEDLAYWTGWVRRRMQHIRDVVDQIDLFVAPARFLLARYRDDFGLAEAKLRYLDYGFDRARLTGRARVAGEPFTFGYIGTHIPAKGIHHLIDAFGRLRGDARLRIWGRPRGQDTDALRALGAALPGGAGARIEWTREYRNQEIVRDVFDHVDAIVVPSIWYENSPLVIHEAQQARVPVITADVGGMAEYVHHEVNGLLFRHRDPAALAAAMQRLVDDPALARRLGERGYPFSATGDVPSVDEHIAAIETIYGELLRRRDSARVRHAPGPWRITFDTNPDTCNLHCIMCEEHSPHSPLQIRRKEEERPRRLMPIALIERVIAEAAPRGLREVIPSTMGEPLLYPDFDRILELCREHRVKLNLTTNGTFPGRGARAWAEAIVPVTSDVKFSWNGATAATHEAIMLGARWEKVLANVREFIAVRETHAADGGDRCRVTFQLTFLESNVAELADIVRLAIDLGVDRVKGHHLWAHFREIDDLSMRRSRDAILRWNEAVAAAQAVAAERTLPSGARVLLENIFPLDPDAAHHDLAPGGPCPFLGQEAWVSAQGRFDPCCAPDAQRRTLGDFGDLHRQGLLDIWQSDAYRGLVAGYRTRALCMGCNMRKPAEVDR
jgi:glycosyltransferase involved in cell wall biosynthesis/MoaA/NifB/PqqE/SkfB family radical SAM enzyme